MRFLFCRNHSYLSRFLCWYFKEPVSHFAIESKGTYCSGLSGMSRHCVSDFLTHNKIVHSIEIKLKEEQEKELIQNLPMLPISTNKLKILYSIIYKKEKRNYLCTEIFKRFPSWLIVEGTRQTNFGLITAYRLYNLMLEHIRKDTVKIESIR